VTGGAPGLPGGSMGEPMMWEGSPIIRSLYNIVFLGGKNLPPRHSPKFAHFGSFSTRTEGELEGNGGSLAFMVRLLLQEPP